MSSLAQILPAEANSLSEIPAPAAAAEADARGLLLAVLTTSACLHLLIVGLLGRGIPAELPRPKPLPAAQPVRVIENVQIKAPPPLPPKTLREALPETPPATPDLPNLEPVAAIAAVPATVKLDFAIRATGPVQLVDTIGQAAAQAEAIPDAPVSLDNGSADGSLLSPPMSYPPDALLKRQSGVVVIEFLTSATGDIYGARVRSSSGHASLDRDALEKLRESRWTGRAGHFTKTYDYTLTLR